MIRLRVAADALAAPGELTLAGDEHAYLAYARRAAVGDAVELFDGAGRRAAATIVAIEPARTRVRVAAARADAPVGPHLTALVPLIKGERMEQCLEKLVEVGVDAIVTYAAARAVVRLEPDRAADRARRWQAVADAAARQAGRAHAPPVAAPSSLAAALAALPEDAARWVGLPDATTPPRWPDGATAGAVLTGPEGGLAPDEVAAALAAGFVPTRLGPHVLRAETAPVIAIALLRA